MSTNRYEIHEHFDWGGWGKLSTTFDNLEDAELEVRKLCLNWSLFVHYSIYDTEENQYV